MKTIESMNHFQMAQVDELLDQLPMSVYEELLEKYNAITIEDIPCHKFDEVIEFLFSK